MTFTVIDNKTGREPSARVIDNIAKKEGLLRMDIAGFALTEDGTLILMDDCGKFAYCDTKRFRVVFDDKEEREMNEEKR